MAPSSNADTKKKGGQKGGHRARKRFGQHWLKSDEILNQIVGAGELSDTDHVLEIGPGQGALTKRLLATAAKVLAVEIDRDLCLALSDKFIAFMASGQFRLIESDFLQLNFDQALIDFELDRPNKVVANIPYYITAPILEKLLGTMRSPNPNPYDSITLLVQKEISDRLCAIPGNQSQRRPHHPRPVPRRLRRNLPRPTQRLPATAKSRLRRHPPAPSPLPYPCQRPSQTSPARKDRLLPKAQNAPQQPAKRCRQRRPDRYLGRPLY